MKHRHVHKRRQKKRLKYYVSILIFLLISFGLISYYIDNKRQPAWNDEYLSNYNSELNKEMGGNSGGLFAISYRMSTDKDIQAYELILQNEIRGIIQGFYISSKSNPFDHSFGTKWEGLYIQSTVRLTDDISWEEFEDIFEPTSDGNRMFASNFNKEQPDVSSKPPSQDQTEENFESSVVNPSEEDLEAIIGQWANNNVGGGSFPGFIGGLSGSIGFITSKSDDHTRGGQQEGNDPVPVPEPSTMILTGSGLIFLFHRIRKSVVGHWKKI